MLRAHEGREALDPRRRERAQRVGPRELGDHDGDIGRAEIRALAMRAPRRLFGLGEPAGALQRQREAQMQPGIALADRRPGDGLAEGLDRGRHFAVAIAQPGERRLGGRGFVGFGDIGEMRDQIRRHNLRMEIVPQRGQHEREEQRPVSRPGAAPGVGDIHRFGAPFEIGEGRRVALDRLGDLRVHAFCVRRAPGVDLAPAESRREALRGLFEIAIRQRAPGQRDLPVEFMRLRDEGDEGAQTRRRNDGGRFALTEQRDHGADIAALQRRRSLAPVGGDLQRLAPARGLRERQHESFGDLDLVQRFAGRRPQRRQPEPVDGAGVMGVAIFPPSRQHEIADIARGRDLLEVALQFVALDIVLGLAGVDGGDARARQIDARGVEFAHAVVGLCAHGDQRLHLVDAET